MEVLKLTDELFNEITNNKEKAVLVDFYADWCGIWHCFTCFPA